MSDYRKPQCKFQIFKNKQKTKKLTKMFVHFIFSLSSPRQFEKFEMKQGVLKIR